MVVCPADEDAVVCVEYVPLVGASAGAPPGTMPGQGPGMRSLKRPSTLPKEYAQGICIHTDENIEHGTSGGPVIDDEGNLVGIVSIGERIGTCPFPRWALPAWICRRICEKTD